MATETDDLAADYPAVEAPDRRALLLRKQRLLRRKKSLLEERNAERSAKEAADGRGLVTDIGLGVLKGPGAAVENAINLVGELGDWLDNNVLPTGGIVVGDEASNGFVEFLGADEFGQRRAAGTPTLSEAELPEVLPETDTSAGRFAQDVSSFIAGFAVFSKQLQASKALAARPWVRAAAAGAAADFTVFDPMEDRLSDFIQQYPALRNPVTDFLEAEEDDQALEGRFKNAVEGLALGVATDGLLRTLRVIRAARRARREAAEAARPDDTLTVKDAPEPAAEPAKVADDVASDAADDALDGAVDEPAGPAVKVDPKKRDELIQRLSDGDLSEADELVDFNADKVNWSALDEPEKVRQLLNTTSEVFAREIGEAGADVQSIAATRRLARSIGGNVDEVHQLYVAARGGRGLAARTMAAHNILVASADRLRVLASQADEALAKGDQSKLVEFRQHAELHAAIQAEVKGAQSEVARTMRVMRELRTAANVSFDDFSEALSREGGTRKVRQALKRITKSTNYADVNDAARRMSRIGPLDWVNELYINNLLSNLTTHVANAVGNTSQVFLGTADRFAAAGVGAARRALTGADNGVTVAEAKALLSGQLKSLGEGLSLGLEAFKKGEPITDARAKAQVRRAIRVSPETIQRWEDEGVAFARLTGHALNVFGEVVRIPGRFLIGSDEFYKHIARRGELDALATRQALAEADARSLRGIERRDFLSARVKGLTKSPSAEMLADADEFARRQVFQDGGKFTRKLASLINSIPLGRVFIAPFITTPTSIFRQTFGERTIIGAASMNTKALMEARRGLRQALINGGAEADIAIARVVVGYGIMATTLGMVMSGNVVGGRGGYRNSEQFDDVKPYSIRVGDTWHQFSRLDPAGMLVGAMVDIVEGLEEAEASGTEGAADEAVTLASAWSTAIINNGLSKTWLQSVSDLAEIMGETNGDRRAIKLEAYFKRVGTNLTPSSALLRQLAKTHDGTVREAFTMTETWKRGIPGLSDDLPVRRDWLGRERTFDLSERIPGSPVAVSRRSDDPLDLELSRLAFDFRMPRRRLEGVELTAQQYSRLLELQGQLVRDPATGLNMEDALRQLVTSAEYQDLLTDEAKLSRVKKLASRYRQEGRRALLNPGSPNVNKELGVAVATAKVEAKARAAGLPEEEIERRKEQVAKAFD